MHRHNIYRRSMHKDPVQDMYENVEGCPSLNCWCHRNLCARAKTRRVKLSVMIAIKFILQMSYAPTDVTLQSIGRFAYQANHKRHIQSSAHQEASVRISFASNSTCRQDIV